MSLMQTSLFYIALTVTDGSAGYTRRKWKLVFTAVISWHCWTGGCVVCA